MPNKRGESTTNKQVEDTFGLVVKNFLQNLNAAIRITSHFHMYIGFNSASAQEIYSENMAFRTNFKKQQDFPQILSYSYYLYTPDLAY